MRKTKSIPADIISKAMSVVDRGYDEGLMDAVAKAIMDERERCARVAEAAPSHFIIPTGIRGLHGTDIAAAIRQGEE